MSMSQQAARPLRAPGAPLPRAKGTPSALGRPSRAAATPVRLRVVAPADSRDGRGPAFIAACVLVMALGLATLLILNTQRAQQSFTIDSLQARSATYTTTQQSLSSALQLTQAPQSLAAKAHALGMVPASGVRYVRPDGTTIGVAKGIAGKTGFTVGPLTTGGAATVAKTGSMGATLGDRVGTPAPAKTPGASTHASGAATKAKSKTTPKSTTTSKSKSKAGTKSKSKADSTPKDQKTP